MRARILEETRLTASAGVSYNKFLAKLASGYRKPNGQFVITPEMGPAFIAALPVAKFHGVGPVTAAKMQHRNRRGLESETALFPAAAFRQIGRMVSRHREWRGRAPGRRRPPAKVVRLRDHLRARSDRANRNRGGSEGHCAGCLGPVREGAGFPPGRAVQCGVPRVPPEPPKPDPFSRCP